MYIEPSIAQKVAMSQMGGETSPVEILSEREFDVFMALANGKTVNQIAETLHLSKNCWDTFVQYKTKVECI